MTHRRDLIHDLALHLWRHGGAPLDACRDIATEMVEWGEQKADEWDRHDAREEALTAAQRNE